MSRTEIVLAVVCSGERICVARRSQAVATSRGLWSVVTGYVEASIDPVTQVWAEVIEELGLTPGVLHLMRRLEPVPLSSPTSGKEFLVHPFLFECDSGSNVVLNWEHEEVQWVEPTRLQKPDCVRWQYALVDALLHAQ